MAEADPRRRMVVTAARLFQRQGYGATGFRQIIAEAGAPRGSIYHHFPEGKEQLATEAIGVAGELVAREIRRVAAATDTGADLVRGVATALAGWLERSEHREGCPVATVALECAPEAARLADACRDAFRSWIALLADRFEADGLAPAVARSQATTAVAAIEGALILCRVERDTSLLLAVGEDIATRLPHSSGSGAASAP